MRNQWSADDAQRCVEHYAERGIGEDLALRTYSARLIGCVPELVMHGGGNTSVKTKTSDLYGETVEVLCIKGSGWDLATIEPQGHPAVRLEPLRRLRALDRLSDEDMVNAQRQNLLDSAAPNPSVEALLHAYLPHRFVDHTHSIAVCAVTDQPDAAALCEAIWGKRVACVPYIMPGFALAKAAAEIFEDDPKVEGLALLKHGLVTFGDTARESYERMIELVTLAEAHIGDFAPELRSVRPARAKPGDAPPAADALPHVRGALSRAGKASGARSQWILDLRAGDEVTSLLQRSDFAELALRGVSTPDHVIRTKGWPLVVDLPAGGLDGWDARLDSGLAEYQARYAAYFQRGDARVGGGKTQLDGLPRLVAVRGLGLAGVGATAADAGIAADLGEAWAATVLRAEAVGRFEPVGEADLFDMEYWSLEQAKLGRAKPAPMAGQVVAVTGAAGAIGAATAKAFIAEGAEVVLLDKDEAAAQAVAAGLGRSAAVVACDLTLSAEVGAAFAVIASLYGGLDVVVSNAGAAWTGMIAEVPDETLRRSFELNLFAHQYVAQAAVRIFRRQGAGGALLFNASKQAVNPGENFGAYGLPKAALMALVRQYALELGGEGVRVNAVNADRIRSGLLTDEMIASRSRSRGVSEQEYMAGNLLREEVRAEDVAQAFVFQAKMRRTTGNTVTVDGGNVAAMLR
jgi:rhamnose utilization protein RhaD (predicted bifunctional aldolase and dehydrogenase)/NAD(P)-dependent dehydrogenase (short-subunit alcohol dehydrogenase family)